MNLVLRWLAGSIPGRGQIEEELLLEVVYPGLNETKFVGR